MKNPMISQNKRTVEELVNKCQKNYECDFISKSNEYLRKFEKE